MSSSTGSRIQLFSGGVDSFALWHLLGQPAPVYVRLGHKYEAAELQTIERLQQSVPALRVRVVDGPQVGKTEQRDGHIPHRNLLLVTTVAALYQPDVVYLGALRGETSRDKSRHFLGQATRLLSFAEHAPLRVEAPARGWTKTQLVRRFLRDFPQQVEALGVTRSCYAASDLPCGRCMACFRRWVAMSNNGIQEEYETNPWENVRVDVGYLWRSPLPEWMGIVHNQLDAAIAIRRAKSDVHHHQRVSL